MIFEVNTPEELSREILSALDGSWDCTEGTLPSTLVLPLCTLAAKVQRMVVDAVPKLLIDETSGPWIDVAAEAIGMSRKAGTLAYCSITFTGKAGATVAYGTQFLTADGLAFSLAVDVTLDSDGEGEGGAYATAVGAAYNIDAGDLVRPAVSLPNVTTFVNTAATGGTDMETDAAFFARLDARRKRPGTSGNAAHYQEWAMEVDGVGFAKILPLADGNGTVTVLLADPDGVPVSSAVIADASAYIETVRPIGATVTVDAPTATELDIVATVAIDATTDMDTVTSAFETAMADFLQAQAAVWMGTSTSYSLSYSRVLVLLASISGVTDVTSMTINGEDESVTLDSNEVGVLGEVTLSVAD